MKITIESTSKIVELNDVPARIWQGETESGIPVHCYITRIAVDQLQDQSQFERELQEVVPPRPDLRGIPARLIL